ncbi:glycine betaine/proline transport system permease protein [Peteryoungia aggregata LMG 23059]|uniref:Glycine betaine/proline transport system permease protein n=1 Tax=Peteryoungia aggregata LMG 23059 TaxID=1368425 RepID=A0ABU0G957_9HYPH|nr:choline ABC transporter permease subunit [Peteryoungia aggregata]MDQ0421876.1 glycine betaine/proline transport system permease protein [Peteryoungia aggregata LMG 23059]
MDFLTDNKLPIGPLSKSFVDWLTANVDFVFDFIATILSASINAMLFVLQAPFLKGTALEAFYPLLMIGVSSLVAWVMRRSLGVTVFTFLGLLLIYNQGYWKETMETLALVLAATGVCMVIGVPIGIACARRPWLYAAVRPVLDLMQTIPTFVYLIPALILFGLGMVPGLIATVIFAIAAPIRLTRLGIISTPPSLVEAAVAFGATPMQVLRKVELPFATPQIMAGLTQTIMLSLSMVVIAALVGASGLGVPVVRALNTVNIARGFEAGLCIVILAIILDRIFRIPGEDT